MIKEYQLTEEEFDKILAINKEGGDPVMFLSGGTPLGQSLTEKINDYWKQLGAKYNFDWTTVKSNGKGNLYFDALSTEKDNSGLTNKGVSEQDKNKIRSIGEIRAARDIIHSNQSLSYSYKEDIDAVLSWVLNGESFDGLEIKSE